MNPDVDELQDKANGKLCQLLKAVLTGGSGDVARQASLDFVEALGDYTIARLKQTDG